MLLYIADAHGASKVPEKCLKVPETGVFDIMTHKSCTTGRISSGFFVDGHIFGLCWTIVAVGKIRNPWCLKGT